MEGVILMEWTATVELEKSNGNAYNALYTINADTEAKARADAIDIAFGVDSVCKATIINIEPQE